MSATLTADEVIAHLKLGWHPEGGPRTTSSRNLEAIISPGLARQ